VYLDTTNINFMSLNVAVTDIGEAQDQAGESDSGVLRSVALEEIKACIKLMNNNL